jgi:predicted DNA-binding transcriptional regulator AlpA
MSNMIDTARIAEMLGITRAHATDKLTKRPGFPKPVVNLSQKLRRWDEAEVRRWVAVQSKREAMSSESMS